MWAPRLHRKTPNPEWVTLFSTDYPVGMIPAINSVLYNFDSGFSQPDQPNYFGEIWGPVAQAFVAESDRIFRPIWTNNPALPDRGVLTVRVAKQKKQTSARQSPSLFL